MSNVLTDRDENNKYSLSQIMPCLFGAFHPTREFFTRIETTITDEELQIRLMRGTYVQ